MQLIFATQNKNKSFEINNLLNGKHEIISLSDIGFTDDIAETGATLEENALIKARHIYSIYKKNCFADDSGLEIEALNNKPGVHSARYAGEHKNDEDNIRKVLQELQNSSNRNAQFRTVIALIIEGKEYLFEGAIKGEIMFEKKGSKGFGYDPIFKPLNHQLSFAEIDIDEKNKISHRALATNKLVDFLSSI